MTQNNKLTDLKDEVRELHPLLQKLLPKLEAVIDVEYTHGKEEFGADFVISQKDKVFEYINYIGIIAKTTKIVQDFTDIERQIDECNIPRTFFNGKEKIRINEIWVITTQHVTKGAQEKIHDKFQSRKIIFIDGIRLTKLVDTYIPSFWNQVILEIGEYLSTTKNKNIEIDKKLSLLPLENQELYVQQDIYNVDNFDNFKKVSPHKRNKQKVDIYCEIDKNNMIIIEGGMGSGKSKLLRHLVDYYTNPNIYLQNEYIPIITTFKTFIDEFDSDIHCLINNKVPIDVKNSKSERSTFLIFLDAMDEKDLSSDEQINLLKKIRFYVETSG